LWLLAEILLSGVVSFFQQSYARIIKR
jgi:hypothetical protein